MKYLGGILLALSVALLIAVPTATISQGIPISGLPPNPAPIGADIFPMVHGGVTMQAAIRSYNTVFVDLLTNQSSIGGNKTFTGTTVFSGTVTGPSIPTLPISVLNGGTGISSPNPTCANPNCTITGTWPSIVITSITPSPAPVPTPAPVPSCASSNCSFTANSVLTVTVTKPIFFYSYLPSTLTATPGPWVPVPYNDSGLTAVADQVLCVTPGSVGTNTVKWQYVTVADPYTGSPTITDITGSSMSWTTAGGTTPSTFTGVNLTTAVATYIRPNVTAVGGTPPSNCTFVLHATH